MTGAPVPSLRLLLASLVIAALVLAACGDGEAPPPRWDAESVGRSIQGAPFQPIIANSNLGVGETRVVLALFTADQMLVHGAEVTMRLYRLPNDPDAQPDVAELAGEHALTARVLDIHEEHQHADPGVARITSSPLVSLVPPAAQDLRLPAHDDTLTTVYTALVQFDRAGIWGAVLDVTVDGQTRHGLLTRLLVRDRTSEPAVGEMAPRTVQPTLADQPIEALTTASPPNPEMHEQTVADAIESGRPVVVAFVTPAFCQTRFCGPVLSLAVMPVWQEFRDRVEFVHIEPFELEAARQGRLVPVPAVEEWGLLAEPYVFVLDGEGRVAARFEGVMDEHELREAVQAVLE